MSSNSTPSYTQKIWVCDGVRVFCRHGTPQAFYQHELNLKDFRTNIGIVNVKHFNDKHTQVLAVDWAWLKDMDLGHLLDDGEFIAYRHCVSVIDAHTAHEISAGIQLLLWQKSHQFCGYCGTKTHPHNQDTAMACPACHQHFYPKIQPCIITAITRSCPNTGNTQILLAQHHRHSDTGMYGLIAGYMEVGESVEMTIHREVMEETGITVENIRYLKSQAWPYPSNLMLGFMADYVAGEIVIDESELSHAQFFDKTQLPLIPPQGTIAFELISQALDL